MSSELMRMLVLQVAGLASVFGYFSPRIMSGVQFLQWLASPDVWALVWGIFNSKGGRASLTVLTESGGSRARFGASGATQGGGFDPFNYLDDLAKAGGAAGDTAEHGGEAG